MIRITAISGSVRRDSTNTRMLQSLAILTRGQLDFQIAPGTGLLPHYNPDLDLSSDEPPQSVHNFREACAQAQAILIACPEYGHGIPGVLKNALDWLVSSGELNHKPVAVTNAYQNRMRGWQGLQSLMQSLRAMDAKLVGNTSLEQSSANSNSVRYQIEALVNAVEQTAI